MSILCAKSHEYVQVDGNTAKIGITDYAVHQLGDIVFVEIPEIGATFSKEEVFGTIESVKAASDLYMPVSGRVTEVNEELVTSPELINEDSFGKGWIIKIQEFNSKELDDLMNQDEYKKYLENEG